MATYYTYKIFLNQPSQPLLTTNDWPSFRVFLAQVHSADTRNQAYLLTKDVKKLSKLDSIGTGSVVFARLVKL